MKISITKKLAGMVIAGSTAFLTMMPMTAFAQVPEEEAQVCICETKCDEEHINPECPVCSYDYGGVKQDDFLNGVCHIRTIMSAGELLKYLAKLELIAGSFVLLFSRR